MWATGKKAAGAFSSYLKATFYGGGTVNNNVWTKMEFKGVSYDNDSEVDIVTNYRWDVKATGFYRLTAMATLGSFVSTDGLGLVVKIYVNGSTLERGVSGVMGGGADGDVTSIHTTSLQLTAGDEVEVYVHQDSGAPRAISGWGNYLTAERFA